MNCSIIKGLFFIFIKTQSNMSEQVKKRQRNYGLFNPETKPKFLCLLYIKQRKVFTEKKFF